MPKKTGRVHRLLSHTGIPKNYRQTFFLTVLVLSFFVGLHFSTTILKFLFLHSSYLPYQVFLSLSASDMDSVSVKLSPPPRSLFQVLPFSTLLTFPFSTLQLCFTSPVSALPLPLVALSQITMETRANNAAPTHLPCSPHK